MAHPNIVMILLDDLGWMDLSCQSSTFYETPNIDRLFRRSMSFDNAYRGCSFFLYPQSPKSSAL